VTNRESSTPSHDAAIVVTGLGKEYHRQPPPTSLREDLARLVTPWRRRADAGGGSLWALRDVSFSVARGERVAVLGRNGAGKSTLLKILCRIVPPSTGEARLRGRTACLLEVGTGFHPELTGRENVFLAGAILGLSRRETAARFTAIVAFAEVAELIDTPVKRWSSGQYVRLGFSIAAHLDPDLLIVDEVLAVGDQFFRAKCLAVMQERFRGDRTLLFVSHDLDLVRAVCPRCLLIEGGTLVFDGPTEEAIARYTR